MERNKQPAEKRKVSDGNVLAVNSIFHTIQGEGPFAGSPSVFIRLAGCNLQCPLCDTEYSARVEMSVQEIFLAVKNAVPTDCRVPPLVVITGGEPFRQSIGPLIKYLNDHDFHVQIETNGTLFQDDIPFHVWGPSLPPDKRQVGHIRNPCLTVVCSPKTGNINKSLLPYIDAFKYVATADSLYGSVDGLPSHALEHPNSRGLARPPRDHTARIYLQAVDEKNTAANSRNVNAVVQSCLKYGYTLCTQIHKLIGVD